MFTPPARAELIRAVDPVAGLPPALQHALDEQGFDPIPRPGPHDWLASHPEPGQTFAAFLARRPPSPDPARRVLYLQPFGPFDTGQEPPVDLLSRFAAAFFALEAVVLPTAPVTGVTIRINSQTGQPQLLTRDLLALLADQRPAGACCIVGITMDDLYPDPAWNFVFGEASPRDRAGVYSFARYLPGEAGPAAASLLLRRACKVLAHETAHLLGIAHCVFYSCLMNGSNHLAESDARPLHLCPVDLRKLQHSIGFDVAARYRRLLRSPATPASPMRPGGSPRNCCTSGGTRPAPERQHVHQAERVPCLHRSRDRRPRPGSGDLSPRAVLRRRRADPA